MIWLVPSAPWHECLLEGLPFLARPGDRSWVVAPHYLVDAVRSLGPERCIVLGPHLLTPEQQRALPSSTTCYETENRFSLTLLEIFRERTDLQWLTWSCTQAQHMAAAHPAGGQHVGYLSLRAREYCGPARKSAPVALFYGSLNPRRVEALGRMAQLDVAVQIEQPGVFGAELSASIDAAAIVVNVHHYDQPQQQGRCGLLETFRIVPALSRGAIVVSETSCDVEQEHELLVMFPGRFHIAPYEQLAAKVAAVIGHIERPRREA